MSVDNLDRFTLDIWLWNNPQLYSELPALVFDNSKDRDKPMNMEEFREYIRRQRRQSNDQRTSTKDDQRECSDVGANKQDEQVHRNYESGTSVKVQSAGT